MGVEQLEWFVDREKQFDGFLKMLHGETKKRIMAVEAAGDMGKTWLIQKLRRECANQSLPYLHIDFRDRRPYDVLYLVRQARDQLGPAAFNLLTETINRATSVNVNLTTSAPPAAAAPSVTVGQISNVTDSRITVQAGNIEVAGGSIVKDNLFVVQSDSPVARQALEQQITDAFFECLGQLAQSDKPAVFLFDSLEEINEEAQHWIWDQLLLRMQKDQLPNVIVILSGRTLPAFGPEWSACMASTGLTPFTEEQVAEYIQGRRQLKDLDVATVFKTSGGMPGLLSKMADVAKTAHPDDEGWL
jgi:hypothetical protein